MGSVTTVIGLFVILVMVAILFVAPIVVAYNSIEGEGPEYTYLAWLAVLFGWLGCVIAIFVMKGKLEKQGRLIPRSRDAEVGDTVALVSPVRLDRGLLRRGHRSEVLAVDVIDGTPVIEIRGPNRTHWVSKDAARVVATRSHVEKT
jgi:hypothetical protein